VRILGKLFRLIGTLYVYRRRREGLVFRGLGILIWRCYGKGVGGCLWIRRGYGIEF